MSRPLAFFRVLRALRLPAPRVQVLLALCVSGGLWAQPPAAIAQKPQAVLDPAVIARIESDLRAPAPNYPQIGAAARAELDRYYAQFIEEKRIEDQRHNALLEYRRLGTNEIRLLALRDDLERGPMNFLGESPYLHRLHAALGRAYEGLDDPRHALAEYAMALRYIGREPAEGAIAPVAGPPAARAAYDARLPHMLRHFADPDRIAQEPDANQATAARNFRTLMEEYPRLGPELAEAERDIYAAEAARARGVDRDVAAARRVLADRQARFDELTDQIDAIRDGAYKQFRDTRRRETGELAYRMALLSRRLDEDERKRSRVENYNTFDRGMGLNEGVWRNSMRDYPGSRVFLELAHNLDPENVTYLDLLVDECRRGRDVDAAIAYQEAALAELTRRSPLPDDLSRHYLRLGALYHEQRNYLRAAQAYARQRALERDPAVRRAAALNLAELHFEHTGRLDAAEALYREYLAAETRDLAAPDMPARVRTEVRAENFRVRMRLAAIARRRQRFTIEAEELQAARSLYYDIESESRAVDAQAERITNRILEIKRALLARAEPELEREYYRLQRVDLTDAQALQAFFRTRLQSLPLTVTLERLAFFAHQARRFGDAQDLYREILRRGDGAQATRARRNIDNIQLSLADGLLRPPVLDPHFER